MVAARAGSKPMSTSRTRIRLRMRRPAPTSSTHANAISVTTRAFRTQVRRLPSVEPRVASFNAFVIAAPRACSAGARPKTMPVTSAMASVKPSAVASVRTLRSSGMLTASSPASARVPANVRARPTSAPVHERTMPSVSICASSRRRPAPRAVRMAISFWRDAARARRRLDRLAQTMSITIATAPASTHTARRMRPPT